MDFLRIRQLARERSLGREAAPQASAGAAGSPAAAVDDAPAAAAPAAPAPNGLEQALRVELDSLFDTGRLALEAHDQPARLEVVAPAIPSAPAPGCIDPLDDFFWREDELAPSLPDLAGSAAMPEPPEVPEVRREWLTFLLAGEEYGIPIEHVREVLKPPALTEVPRAPAHVLGVIMVRGEVIAVLDPRHELGVAPATQDRQARVLICDAGDGPRGLVVDAVSQVIRLPPSAVEARPGGIGGSADCIAGIGHDRGRLVILLDTAILLGGVAIAPSGEEAAP